MKIKIEAESQVEFDEKRPELIKALAGSKWDVEIRARGEKRPGDPGHPFYGAQAEMQDHWDKLFISMIRDLKDDIEEIISK